MAFLTENVGLLSVCLGEAGKVGYWASHVPEKWPYVAFPLDLQGS